MAVAVFGDIPEVFLFLANTVDGLGQAAGEEIGKGPDDLVNFFVQQFKVRVGLMLSDLRPRFFKRFSLFKFTVDNFTVFNIFVVTNLGVLEVTSKGFRLVERAPGVTVETIKQATEGTLIIEGDIPEMAV